LLENQGLFGVAFFESTAFLIIFILFLLFRRDFQAGFFRFWLFGWLALTLSSISELALLYSKATSFHLAIVILQVAAFLLFLVSVAQYSFNLPRRLLSFFPLIFLVLAAVYYLEHSGPRLFASLRWPTSIFLTVLCLVSGWLVLRSPVVRRSYGVQLLAGSFLMHGLHEIDRPLWILHPYFLLRVAFDHLLAVSLGVSMIVLVLERARTRTEELNDKMNRLTLLTAASTQTLSVQEVIERVLFQLVESLSATHGIVRALEHDSNSSSLVVRAAVGFDESYLREHAKLSSLEPWAMELLKGGSHLVQSTEFKNSNISKRMAEAGLKAMVSLPLPGKDGPLGTLSIGSTRTSIFQPDELAYLSNMVNFLGLTLQNVRLFEQVRTAQKQWEYTFDSIGDPVFVHDPHGRILRGNQRLVQLLHRDFHNLIGKTVSELFSAKSAAFQVCPYCEGVAGEGDDPDPWLPGYFLASNSLFADHDGRKLGTVHVLKDITDRKRAEEKYRSLVSSVQEGIFISTPQGRFLDFNDALLRMSGFDSREELLSIDIGDSFYANPADRDRLRKLLEQHGSVADFEFEMRRKDGELRTMIESSTAVKDAAGNVTAYQGFLLDITERKRAESEIRRRNRELMVLNSISQTLTESLDLGNSLNRTLRQMAELFDLDAASLHLFDKEGTKIRRAAVYGHRSEYARHFPEVDVKPQILQQIKAARATFISAQGLPLPPIFREAQLREEIVSAYIVVLWSKDKVIGGLVVGSRSPREFSSADINLLIAVGSQVSSALERSLLYEETRLAYENLRRTQEQLLHSEKLAAVGQLISGVAHELNNPLTAILGYSQLLTSNTEMGRQAIEYTEKLYKQAQRTHRIVQNLLSFARQHKPERIPVQVNQTLEETLALRDYDLRMSNIRVHLDLAPDLPKTAADPHQLQQVFLNLVNNAVDAILENHSEGDLWVRTAMNGDRLAVEFTDSGPGVKDTSRVFDPFYTTKPVGKGTGLGLSICYGIITEHGGTILVRNIPTRGACFTIELPHQAPALFVPSTTQQAIISGRDAAILLLDQDDSVLEAVGAILRNSDHRVDMARNLREARAMIAEHKFDVVVADLIVAEGSEESGLLDWIGHHYPALASRVVWIAAVVPSPELRDKILAKGTRVLQKPFKSSELLAAVDDLILNRVGAVPVER
jgi:PAS domain S-box-containing protein